MFVASVPSITVAQTAEEEQVVASLHRPFSASTFPSAGALSASFFVLNHFIRACPWFPICPQRHHSRIRTERQALKVWNGGERHQPCSKVVIP